jgi:hypothetical protein
VGKIVLEVDTSGDRGRITKKAKVHSNDPSQPTASLTFIANVIPCIVIEPVSPRVNLVGLVGDDIRKVIKIRAGDGHPLEIRDLKTNLDKWIDFNLKREEGGHSYELEIIPITSSKISRRGYVTVLTNHPNRSEVKIPIYIRLRPEMEIRPQHVDFGLVPRSIDRSQRVKRTLTLTNHRKERFHLQKLRYNKEYFQVQTVPARKEFAARYRIVVMPLLDHLPAGKTTDTLIIETDVPETGRFQVPINISIK